MNFGAALVAAGLALGSYSLAQLPGTSLPPGIRAGAVNCTPNTVNGTFANVVGLWHFDNTGTDQATTPHSVSSLAGGAVYSATQSKFGGYSLNIVTTATSFANIPAGINLTTGDWTVEAWMYQQAISTYTGYIGDDDTTTGWGHNPAPFMWASGSVFTIPGSPPAWSTMMPGGSWHHVAWSRLSGAASFYFDGVMQGSGSVTVTGNIGNGTTAWKIGRAYSATYTMPSNSFIDEVRISNVARYTANFTPPILAFCNN